MIRRIIRTDGAEVPFDRRHTMSGIAQLLGCDLLDIVKLRHLGIPLQVMLVDDASMVSGKPVNAKATALYHANCKPGTTSPICGDVAIVFDEDFA